MTIAPTRHDGFLSGTIPAEGAGVARPHVGAPDVPDLLFIIVPDGTVLDSLFECRRRTATPEWETAVVGEVGWAVAARAEAPFGLAKFHLDLVEPVPVSASLLLIADRYTEPLRTAAVGGPVALLERDTHQQLPAGASYVEFLERAALIDTPASQTLPFLLDHIAAASA